MNGRNPPTSDAAGGEEANRGDDRHKKQTMHGLPGQPLGLELVRGVGLTHFTLWPPLEDLMMRGALVKP